MASALLASPAAPGSWAAAIRSRFPTTAALTAMSVASVPVKKSVPVVTPSNANPAACAMLTSAMICAASVFSSAIRVGRFVSR